MQTNIFLLEGKKTEQRLFSALKSYRFGTPPPLGLHLQHSTCGLQSPALHCSSWLGLPGRSPCRQAGSAHSSCLRTPKMGRLHTNGSIACLRHAGKSHLGATKQSGSIHKRGDRHEQTCWKRLEAALPQPRHTAKPARLPALQN